MFAKFDEIPGMTLQDIKETKCNGRTDAQMDNVKTVPSTNKVCRGYKAQFRTTKGNNSNRIGP